MADFRMIKTKIWRDKKFKSWNAPTKLLSWYLMTNEYVPPSGLYEIDLDVVRLNIGFNGDTFTDAFDKLISDSFIMYDDGFNVVWIVNYLKHFPGRNQGVMANVFESLTDLSNCPLADRFKERYSSLLGGWEQGVRTLQGEEKSRVKKRKEKSLTPSPTQSIFDFWDKCYKAATGEKYPFFGERDGKIFKSLAVKYGGAKVNSLIGEFFKQADKDPDCWWSDKLDVVVWYRQIPKLITRLTRG